MTRTRSVGDVVAESFSAIMPFMGRFVMLSLLAGVAYGVVAVLLFPDNMEFKFNFSWQMFIVFNFLDIF